MFLSLLLDLYPGDVAVRWIVYVLVEVTVLIAVACWVVRRWQIRSAAVRDGVWLATLVAILAAPLATVVVPRLGIKSLDLDRSIETVETMVVHHPLWQPSAADRPVEPRLISGDAAAPSGTPQATAEQAAKSPGRSSLPSNQAIGSVAGMDAAAWYRLIVTVALGIWAVGTIALLVRLISGWLAVVRFRSGLSRIEHPLQAEVARIIESVRPGRRVPELVLSDAVSGPLVVGILRPTIVLPADLPERLPADQLHDVLLHETAHVLRRDNIVGLLQRLAAAVFWPHPLVHSLNRRLSQTREEVCDNYALQFGDRHQYARALLSVAEQAGRKPTAAWTVGLLDPKWKLEERIAGLLDEARNLRLTTGRGRLLSGFAAVAVAVVLMSSIDAGRPSQAEAIAHLRNVGVHISGPNGLGEGTDRVLIPYDWTGTTADLRYLSSVGGIQELWLSGVELEEVRLRDLPDLKRLIFNRSFYHNQQRRQVNLGVLPIKSMHLKNLPQITELDLGDTQVSRLTLNNMPGLELLRISHAQAGDDVLTSLSGAPNLREISIGPHSGFHQNSVEITDKGLAGVARLPKLESLGLGETQITDAGLATLAEATTLQGLGLASPYVTDAGLDHIAKLTNLQNLYLGGSKITDTGLSKLQPLKKLNSIGLGGTGVTHSGIAQLQAFPDLVTVSLSPSQLNPQSCEALAALPKLARLNVLGPSEETAVIGGLNELKGLYVEDVQRMQIRPESLAEVEYVVSSNVGPDAMRSLFENFQHMHAVTHIEMRPGRHADGTFRADTPLPLEDDLPTHWRHLTALEMLVVSGASQIGDAGVAHLAGLKNLKRLILNNSQITDVGAASLSELTNLEHVQLSGTQITNGGLIHFKNLKNLKQLILNNTQVDEEGVRLLEQDLPNTQIQAYQFD
jgi:beta-lactamase regulating signal transducer with metallopeptidase domain/Leucine-rich repeat (LRR) protein